MRIAAAVLFLVVGLAQLASGGYLAWGGGARARGATEAAALAAELARAGVTLDPEQTDAFGKAQTSSRREQVLGIVVVASGVLCLAAGVLLFARARRAAVLVPATLAIAGEGLDLALTSPSSIALAAGIAKLGVLAFCVVAAAKVGSRERAASA
jgi:hypothetical protein